MQIKVVTESTVSRVDERADEAPGSVYVFPRSLIAERGYRSLGELLQTVPGFTVFQKDLQLVAGVRGLNANDNEKISLLVNGQNLNNVNEPDFLNGPINLDTVERVEVVVGPSSFFQQANTLAATVNVITKNVEGVEAVGAAGNDLEHSASLMAGHHWASDQFLSFSFTSEAKRGFDAWDNDFRKNLAGRTVTGELGSPSFFSVLNGQYKEWTAQAVAYRSTSPELLIDNGDRRNNGIFTDQFYSLFLQNEHPLTDDLTSIVRLDGTLKQQSRLNESGLPINALQSELNQWNYNGEAELRYTGFTGQFIQTGVQLSFDRNFDSWYTFNSTATGENVPKTTLLDNNSEGIGFYIDDTFKLAKWLKIVEGVRADYNSKLNGERWFPGARSAIIVDPTANWVAKLVYNRSVRMPSDLAADNEVWGVDHPGTSPSFARLSPQAQEPEILQTVELQNIVYFKKARVSATLYHQELQDFITWESPHTNVGNFRGNGVELSIQVPLYKGVVLWGNGSWNDSKLNLFQLPSMPPTLGGSIPETHHAYTNPDHRIIGSAEYTANLGLDCKILDHLTFAPSVRYFANQAGLDTLNDGSSGYTNISNRYYLDAALTWDHVAGHDMDLRLSGHNLLDNRKSVASQFFRDTYKPRGTEIIFTIDLRF